MDGRFEKAKRPSRFTRSPASEIFHGLEQNACSNPKKTFRIDIHKQAVSLALFPTWQVVLPISDFAALSSGCKCGFFLMSVWFFWVHPSDSFPIISHLQ